MSLYTWLFTPLLSFISHILYFIQCFILNGRTIVLSLLLTCWCSCSSRFQFLYVIPRWPHATCHKIYLTVNGNRNAEFMRTSTKMDVLKFGVSKRNLVRIWKAFGSLELEELEYYFIILSLHWVDSEYIHKVQRIVNYH